MLIFTNKQQFLDWTCCFALICFSSSLWKPIESRQRVTATTNMSSTINQSVCRETRLKTNKRINKNGNVWICLKVWQLPASEEGPSFLHLWDNFRLHTKLWHFNRCNDHNGDDKRSLWSSNDSCYESLTATLAIFQRTSAIYTHYVYNCLSWYGRHIVKCAEITVSVYLRVDKRANQNSIKYWMTCISAIFGLIFLAPFFVFHFFCLLCYMYMNCNVVPMIICVIRFSRYQGSSHFVKCYP